MVVAACPPPIDVTATRPSVEAGGMAYAKGRRLVIER
jgi:hypothetical protein